MDLKIHHRAIDAADVFTVTGEVDVYNAPQLRQQLTAATAHPDHLVVIDLSGVAFMDSAGLGALASALRRSRTQAGQIRLAGLQPAVSRVMTITRMIRSFHIYPNVTAALHG